MKSVIALIVLSIVITVTLKTKRKMQEEKFGTEEGWYLCVRDGNECTMYNDGKGQWHLSAYDTNDVVHRRLVKDPHAVLKKIN